MSLVARIDAHGKHVKSGHGSEKELVDANSRCGGGMKVVICCVRGCQKNWCVPEMYRSIVRWWFSHDRGFFVRAQRTEQHASSETTSVHHVIVNFAD